MVEKFERMVCRIENVRGRLARKKTDLFDV